MANQTYKFRFDGFERYSQDQWAYNGAGLVEYHGIAKKGAATSDSVWLIERWTYNGDNNAVTRTTSAENVKWDDRVTTPYS